MLAHTEQTPVPVGCDMSEEVESSNIGLKKERQEGKSKGNEFSKTSDLSFFSVSYFPLEVSQVSREKQKNPMTVETINSTNSQLSEQVRFFFCLVFWVELERLWLHRDDAPFRPRASHTYASVSRFK